LQAGRYLNAVGWHLSVAWLLHASLRLETADDYRAYGDTKERLADHYNNYLDPKERLIDNLRAYVPVKKRAQLQRSVEKSLEWPELFYGTEDHRNGVEGMASLFEWEVQRGGVPTLLRKERCRDALTDVDCELDRPSTDISGYLDEAAELAVRLGVCIDRAMRPPALDRELYRRPTSQPFVLPPGSAISDLWTYCARLAPPPSRPNGLSPSARARTTVSHPRAGGRTSSGTGRRGRRRTGRWSPPGGPRQAGARVALPGEPGGGPSGP
jgi:hypothetical protein